MSNNTTNLVGEFYAMSRFFLEGYIATLTLGNTKGVDILLLNPKNNKTVKIEVKTCHSGPVNSRIFGNNLQWIMNKKHEELNDHTLIFCFIFVNKLTKKYQLFLVPSKDVAEYCKFENKKWHESDHKKPVATGDMRMFRIPFGIKSSYEDNFSLFD